MKIAIIGAGELGKLITHHAQQSIENYDIAGYYDDFNREMEFNNFPILGQM